MAGRRRKYVFTPARRAALRKARKISAMKRHARAKAPQKSNKLKSLGKGVLAVGAATGSVFVAYHTEQYIVHPSRAVRDVKTFGKVAGSGARALHRRVRPAKLKPLASGLTYSGGSRGGYL